MKKILALLLTIIMTFSFVACAGNGDGNETSNVADSTAADSTPAQSEADDSAAADSTPAESGADDTTGSADVKVMTYAEYIAADIDAAVVIEAYVQAKQSWWDNKATLYTQDNDGAYFIYNAAVSEEDYAKLVPGTKIRVTGYKANFSGEIEIAEGATVEILEGSFVATPFDATALLGTDDLIKHQNELVSFKGLTVAAYDESGAAFAYKNPTEKTDDLYFKVNLNDKTYEFCVEFYLCGKDTDVYKAVEALKVGDKIDVEGFLYWYEGANPHITSVKAAQ